MTGVQTHEHLRLMCTFTEAQSLRTIFYSLKHKISSNALLIHISLSKSIIESKTILFLFTRGYVIES
jgi:hypothetical protein